MKLQAKDFRIGNLINCNGDIRPIDLQDLQNMEEGLDFYKAVPVSVEWLQKLGFTGWRREISLNDGRPQADIFFAIPDGFDVRMNREFPKYKNDFIIDCYLGKEVEPGAYEALFYYKSNPMKMGTELKFAHQVQNLFCSLHNEELELK